MNLWQNHGYSRLLDGCVWSKGWRRSMKAPTVGTLASELNHGAMEEVDRSFISCRRPGICALLTWGKDGTPGCTMRRMQVGKGSVMLLAMFCQEILVLPFMWVLFLLVARTWTLLQIKYTISGNQYSRMAVASFSRIMCHVRQIKGFRNGYTLSTQFPRISTLLLWAMLVERIHPWRPCS